MPDDVGVNTVSNRNLPATLLSGATPCDAALTNSALSDAALSDAAHTEMLEVGRKKRISDVTSIATAPSCGEGTYLTDVRPFACKSCSADVIHQELTLPQ